MSAQHTEANESARILVSPNGPDTFVFQDFGAPALNVQFFCVIGGTETWPDTHFDSPKSVFKVLGAGASNNLQISDQVCSKGGGDPVAVKMIYFYIAYDHPWYELKSSVAEYEYTRLPLNQWESVSPDVPHGKYASMMKRLYSLLRYRIRDRKRIAR